MGQQMTDLERRVIRTAIHKAKTYPRDIAECLELVRERNILSIEKVDAYWNELWDVCRQAMLAMGTIPQTPPRGAIPPPSPVDPVPDIPHGDGELLAAVYGSRDKSPDAVFLAIHGQFEYANAKFTNTQFSYILQKTVKSLKLHCRNGVIEIRWKQRVSAPDDDHTARATVFILVSEEEAAKLDMKVDILFGKNYREDPDIQLRAFSASLGVRSAPSPCQVQPHHTCAGSVTEAACSTCTLRLTASGLLEAPHIATATHLAACRHAYNPIYPKNMEESQHEHRRSPRKPVFIILKKQGPGTNFLQRLASKKQRNTQKGYEKKKRKGVRDRRPLGRAIY